MASLAQDLLALVKSTCHWLVIIATPPYTHALDSDPAIDLILAAGAFGQTATVVFVGNGLNYLSADVTVPEGHSDTRKLLKTLPLFDIEYIYALTDSNDSRLYEIDVPITAIDSQHAGHLVSLADNVVTF